MIMHIVIECKETCTYFQITPRCAIDGNEISIFLSSCQDTKVILNYDVTYQLNIQVKYIVQKYHLKGKHKNITTPVIHVTLSYT